MTDREFEKMWREEAKGEKRSQNERMTERKKKEEEKEEDENDDDHNGFCDICKDGRDLLLCDSCSRSWHKECAKIDGEILSGEWKCPKCVSIY